MEARKNYRHFEDWVGSLGQLSGTVSDLDEKLEWEESEVVWSVTSPSSPSHDSPDLPLTGGNARSSRSHPTAVLSGHDSHMIRKKLVVDPVTVASAISRGRNLSSDVVESGSWGLGHVMTGMSAPMYVPAWSSWMARGREAEEAADSIPVQVPPHIIAANSNFTRMMACSVFEGAGRTLKGRDLRRVRDGVFRKTGFLD